MFGNYKKLELKMMEYIDREISRKCPLKCVGVYHTGALVEKIDWLNKRIDKLEKGIYDTNTTRSLLDEVEKKYLSDVIRPYDVEYIKKSEGVSENLEFLNIKVNGEFRGGERIMLPYFKKGTMYKGMELNKEYSLKELGLE